MTDFGKTHSFFNLPSGIIYLDGNSLGPLPVSVSKEVERVIVEEWGGQLVKSWNTAGWMTQPQEMGDRIGRLIGAPAGSVVMGDTLSIKLFQTLAAALALNPSGIWLTQPEQSRLM